jgi:ABC-type glycerol-3-phosphate transport system substrate-binding protein
VNNPPLTGGKQNGGDKAVKRFLAVICALTLLLAILAGCNGTVEQTPSPTPEDTRTALERFEEEGMTQEVLDLMIEEQAAETVEQMREKEIITDYDQTGNLEIWIPPTMRETLFLPAIDLYKRMYPNVNVIALSFRDTLDINSNYNTYITQLAAGLMAGKGPDVLFPSYMPPNVDLYKMADNGVFYDLNEFIDLDKDFNLNDYIRGVMDGGIFKGKRYAMPIDYRVDGILLSLPVHLDKIGFDSSQLSDVVSFMNEVMRTLPEAQKQQNFRVVKAYRLWWDFLFDASGIKLIDYETETVLPDEDGLRRLVEAYKPYYSLDNKDFQNTLYEHLVNGDVLFDSADFISGFFMNAIRLRSGIGYQINAIHGVDGKVHAQICLSAAIRSGSKEKQNAWNFIKLLLSPEIQSNKSSMTYLSVQKDSLSARIQTRNDLINGVTSEGIVYTNLSNEEMQKYIDMLIDVDRSSAFRNKPLLSPANSNPIYRLLEEHIIPFWEDKVSLDIAIEGLRNSLRLYVSE